MFRSRVCEVLAALRCPPDARSCSPVSHPESGPARKTATAAMSAGCPMRPSEACAAAFFSKAEPMKPADANPRDLARYVYTVCHGLAVQSFGGATRKQTRKQLRRVVDIAMRAWPK